MPFSSMLALKSSCELFSLMILSSQASFKVFFRENESGPRWELKKPHLGTEKPHSIFLGNTITRVILMLDSSEKK